MMSTFEQPDLILMFRILFVSLTSRKSFGCSVICCNLYVSVAGYIDDEGPTTLVRIPRFRFGFRN